MKQSQLPSSYLDGTFLMAPKGKEANPYVDPTKLKMGLVTAKGVSIAKSRKGDAGKDDKKPFYPAVGKWNQYTSSVTDESLYKRLGAPFPYVEEKEVRVNSLPKEGGTLLLSRTPGGTCAS